MPPYIVVDVTSFQLFETQHARGGCIDGELMGLCLRAWCIQSRFFMSVISAFIENLWGLGAFCIKCRFFEECERECEQRCDEGTLCWFCDSAERTRLWQFIAKMPSL